MKGERILSAWVWAVHRFFSSWQQDIFLWGIRLVVLYDGGKERYRKQPAH